MPAIHSASSDPSPPSGETPNHLSMKSIFVVPFSGLIRNCSLLVAVLVPLHSDFDRFNKSGPNRPMPVPHAPTDQFDSSTGSISKSQNHCAEVLGRRRERESFRRRGQHGLTGNAVTNGRGEDP